MQIYTFTFYASYSDGTKKEITNGSKFTISYTCNSQEIPASEFGKNVGFYIVRCQSNEKWNECTVYLTVEKESVEEGASLPIGNITIRASKTIKFHETFSPDDMPKFTYKNHPDYADGTKEIGLSGFDKIYFVEKSKYDACATEDEKIALLDGIEKDEVDENGSVTIGPYRLREKSCDDSEKKYLNIPTGTWYLFSKVENMRNLNDCWTTPMEYTVGKGTAKLVDNFDLEKLMPEYTFGEEYGYDEDGIDYSIKVYRKDKVPLSAIEIKNSYYDGESHSATYIDDAGFTTKVHYEWVEPNSLVTTSDSLKPQQVKIGEWYSTSLSIYYSDETPFDDIYDYAPVYLKPTINKDKLKKWFLDGDDPSNPKVWNGGDSVQFLYYSEEKEIVKTTKPIILLRNFLTKEIEGGAESLYDLVTITRNGVGIQTVIMDEQNYDEYKEYNNRINYLDLIDFDITKENPGVYEYVYKLNYPESYCWDDGTTENKKFTYTIGKATPERLINGKLDVHGRVGEAYWFPEQKLTSDVISNKYLNVKLYDHTDRGDFDPATLKFEPIDKYTYSITVMSDDNTEFIDEEREMTTNITATKLSLYTKAINDKNYYYLKIELSDEQLNAITSRTGDDRNIRNYINVHITATSNHPEYYEVDQIICLELVYDYDSQS